ncbi:MAG TPA: hypothetical protein VKU02_13555 [Gemmataceae bacterium]|nr:hypothetical protein [Gemmataceae bacterium]
MRQRRNRLQVSTFPFLAVLLCAMGSLILLLLVMDRRAKVVARARAMRAIEQAVSQAVAEDEMAAAQRRAEWERRRQLLHQQLQQQDQQVLRDLQRIQGQATAAAGSVQQELVRSREMEGRLRSERAQLAQLESALLAHRAEATVATQQDEMSRTELARLTAELERMERCIADLKTARQRQQRMVSLVPYRGKHGDNRKPIYIECNGDDLIFHPDHLALHAASGSAVRVEMDRRLAQQRADMQLVHEKPDASAYLLMLVRPNGITTYYRTLAALKGLQIDFGYEFIDQEWILDFSEDEANPKTQPWSAAARTDEQPPPKSSAKMTEAMGSLFSGRPPGLVPQAGSGGPMLGRPTGILASRAGGASNASFGNGGGGGSSGGNGGSVTPGDQGAGLPVRTVPRGSGSSGLSSEGSREITFADVLAGGGRPRGAGERSLDGGPVTASPPEQVQGRPAFSQAGMAASPGGLAASSGGPVASQGGPGERTGTSRPPSEGETRSESGPGGTRSAPSKGTNDVSKEGPPKGSGTSGGDASSGLLPQFTPANSRAPGNPESGNPGSGASPGPTSAKPVPATLGQGSPNLEEPARGGGGDPFDRFGLPSSKARPARAEALRPRPLIGNRDWVISIECTAEGLVLLPSRQRIPTAQIARGENESNPLLEAVQQMMARRQATVRPGEPPYRPMIRFRVLPDGLRSYHLAYPVLEGLQVPMTRENVDPEEAKTMSRERS